MNRKRSIKNITVFLLSFLLLFQTSVVFAMGGTVSGNQPAGEAAIAAVSENRFYEGEELTEETEATEESASEEEEDVIEDTVSGQSLSEVQTGATNPANPVHHCTKKGDGSDYTDFSYIYFGSYPQSEVTDGAVIADIEKAIATSGVAAEAGRDVWVNGIKYRRISKADTNNDSYFDEVTNSGYRYFKWERIKWKVLKNDGKTLFVAADKAMDCENFNNTSNYSHWAGSNIRNWLSNSFYNAAFNSREQSAITMKTVMTEGELNATNDNIYLLSKEEAASEEYGFCSESNVKSMSRRMKASDYANARGADRSSSYNYRLNCNWWLRSSSKYSGWAVAVSSDGTVILDGHSVNSNYCGVCPALRINLSSDVWSMTDDGTSGNGGEEKPKGTKITRLTVTGPSAKLAAGKTVTLSLQVFPENAANKAVSFQSSNSKYASVDKKGKVTVKKAGIGKNVTITITALDGSQVKASYKFKIMKHAVKKISLKAPKKTLKAGKTMTVKATVKTTGKSANKSLKWTSSNKKYATVNKKGKVTAKKAGKGKTVTITAASTDGSNKKANVKIKIK